VGFSHFGCFQVGTWPNVTEIGNRFSEWQNGLCVIWLKFGMITYSKIPVGKHEEWTFVDAAIGNGSKIPTPGVVPKLILGAPSATDQDTFTKFVV